MAYTPVNWNTTTTYINPSNLDTMEQGIINNDANIEELKTGSNLITNGDPILAGYKIDGKEVYKKRISGTLSGSGQSVISNVMGSITGYTPIKFEAFFNSGALLFSANTPRGSGLQVADSQIFTYWNFSANTLVVTSNGFDRTGTTVEAELYFTLNN